METVVPVSGGPCEHVLVSEMSGSQVRVGCGRERGQKFREIVVSSFAACDVSATDVQNMYRSGILFRANECLVFGDLDSRLRCTWNGTFVLKSKLRTSERAVGKSLLRSGKMLHVCASMGCVELEGADHHRRRNESRCSYSRGPSVCVLAT